MSDQKDFQLALNLCAHGKFIEARDFLLSFGKEKQKCFDFNFYLGATYFHLSDWTNAIKFLTASTNYMHPTLSPFHLLGMAYVEQGDFYMAILNLHEALQLDNANPDIQNDLGVALQKSGKYTEAIDHFNISIALDPLFKDAYNNKGICLCSLNRFADAVAEFHKALNLDPSFFISHINLALAFQMLGDFENAMVHINQAIHLNPDDNLGKWNKANLLLLLDRYEEGWPLYELRWETVKARDKRYFDRPLWLGYSSINHKTILIHSEQGYGDVIQCARYLPLLKSLGANVIFEVPHDLQKLMSNMEGIDIVNKNEIPKDFDFHCPIMSLPMAFKTNIHNIPSHDYLKNFNTNKSQILNKNIHSKNAFLNIGICWSGSNTLIENHMRSIGLEILEPLLNLPVNFHVIQKHIRPEEKFSLDRLGIRYYDHVIKDFYDTASLINLMDLVITIDTSTAHLASSLNKKTWILLPYVPDWRWGIDRNHCPWYSTASLYRQTIVCSWTEPLNRIINDLTRLIRIGTLQDD